MSPTQISDPRTFRGHIEVDGSPLPVDLQFQKDSIALLVEATVIAEWRPEQIGITATDDGSYTITTDDDSVQFDPADTAGFGSFIGGTPEAPAVDDVPARSESPPEPAAIRFDQSVPAPAPSAPSEVEVSEPSDLLGELGSDEFSDETTLSPASEVDPYFAAGLAGPEEELALAPAFKIRLHRPNGTVSEFGLNEDQSTDLEQDENTRFRLEPPPRDSVETSPSSDSFRLGIPISDPDPVFEEEPIEGGAASSVKPTVVEEVPVTSDHADPTPEVVPPLEFDPPSDASMPEPVEQTPTSDPVSPPPAGESPPPQGPSAPTDDTTPPPPTSLQSDSYVMSNPDPADSAWPELDTAHLPESDDQDSLRADASPHPWSAVVGADEPPTEGPSDEFPDTESVDPEHPDTSASPSFLSRVTSRMKSSTESSPPDDIERETDREVAQPDSADPSADEPMPGAIASRLNALREDEATAAATGTGQQGRSLAESNEDEDTSRSWAIVIGVTAGILALLAGVVWGIMTLLASDEAGETQLDTATTLASDPAAAGTAVASTPTTVGAVTTSAPAPTTTAVVAPNPDAVTGVDAPTFVAGWNRLAGAFSESLTIAGSALPIAATLSPTIQLEYDANGVLTITATPQGDDSDRDILIALGAAVAWAEPDISGDERKAVLAAIGIDVDQPQLANMNGTNTRAGLQYQSQVIDNTTLELQIRPAG